MKLKKKKAIAKQLIIEKERVIHDGLKDRARKIEEDQTKKLMNLALHLDPKKEIEKRFNNMKRAMEESSEQLDSVRSMSMSGAESMGKKKVKFENENKYRSPSAHSGSGMDDSSSRHSNSNNKFEDSIGESISM
jgi:hypothetical protein